MSDIQTTRELIQAIKESEKGPKAYDTTAKVVRVSGNTAWVHIPGGIDETPVQMSINAQEGDTVNVRVSGGDAWITGNNSAPPTDDTKAKKAEVKANQAGKAATVAQKMAENAAKTSTNYVTADDEGLMVADMRNGRETPSTATTNNVLIDSNGMKVREGTTDLATFGATLIELGKNAVEAVIKFCKGVFQITAMRDEDSESMQVLLDARDTYNADDASTKITMATIAARNTKGNANKRAYVQLVASADENESQVIVYGDTIELVVGQSKQLNFKNLNYTFSGTFLTINGFDSLDVQGKAYKAIADENGYIFADSYLGIRNTAATALTSDLDNLTGFGIHYYSSTAGHAPSSAGGLIFNLPRSSTYTTQIAFANNSASGGESKIYTRHHNSSGYGSWKQIQLA